MGTEDREGRDWGWGDEQQELTLILEGCSRRGRGRSVAVCPLCRDWDRSHRGNLSFGVTVASAGLLLFTSCTCVAFSFVVTFGLRSRRADFSEAVALSLSCCCDKLSFWG